MYLKLQTQPEHVDEIITAFSDYGEPTRREKGPAGSVILVYKIQLTRQISQFTVNALHNQHVQAQDIS